MGAPARDEPVGVLGILNFRHRTLLRTTSLTTRTCAELAPAVGVPNPLLPETHHDTSLLLDTTTL